MPLRSVATLLLLLVLAARPDEGARIAPHLTYVLEQLRAATPPGHARRTAALESYIARGQFPRRTDDGWPEGVHGSSTIAAPPPKGPLAREYLDRRSRRRVCPRS